ncbi:membrane protein [Kitasatospora xanthocidica]|uniref:Bax inhibitor-1/YccA family protein n=1 Tax=Kitasatospora xanthocidica TaxID=83382 RepID=UPI001679226D|nr:Bax inhibitor-1/YccA family protein [Kitasatospora xanthocidica]GHF75539.1 membrane protein [Kitasatospora xanthocidica]
MKSTNPVLSRWGATRTPAPADTVLLQPVGVHAGGPPESDLRTHEDPTPVTPMTLDDVVVRTATTLGTTVLTAVLSWLLLPVDAANLGTSYGIALGAAAVAFALAMLQSVRRQPSPALILGYAAFEGLFLGVISSATSTHLTPGVVVQTVLGTFAVAAGVLLAYRMRWIRVTHRFAGFLTAAATGFLLLLLADTLFSAFGAGNGLGFHSGGLGLLFGAIGVLLGAGFLALDFRQIEDALTDGAPREDAWLAAFGLTTTLVWIYLEILQVLSLFNSNDN